MAHKALQALKELQVLKAQPVMTAHKASKA
jgi:hypothetical protein